MRRALKSLATKTLKRGMATQAIKRNLLLLSLDWTRPKDPPMALGHASILANLRQKNIPVIEKSYSVNQPQFSSAEVVNFILQNVKQNKTTDLAIGAFIWNESALQTIMADVRRGGFSGRIILGGPQVSYVKRGVEHYYPLADVFIRGYGEEALAQLISAHDEKPVISGVHYANETDLGLSAKIDLSDMPSPFLSGVIAPQHFIRSETQRGCPFRCSFCQHRESDSSQQRRHFHESRIMHEIAWITQHKIINDIAILDPTFNSGPNYIKILTEYYSRGYTGKLSLQCRIEMVTPEFLDIVEKLNQKGKVVLEFGLQTIHRNEQVLIQRPNNMKKVAEILDEVQRRNIPVEISLIFGLPGQTVSSFRASIDFCKHHQVGTIYAFPLMLLRGTPLEENKRQLNLVESTDIQIDGVSRIQQDIPHVVASDTFTFTEWQQMAAMASALNDYNQKMAQQTRQTPNKITPHLSASLWKRNNKDPAVNIGLSANPAEYKLS